MGLEDVVENTKGKIISWMHEEKITVGQEDVGDKFDFGLMVIYPPNVRSAKHIYILKPKDSKDRIDILCEVILDPQQFQQKIQSLSPKDINSIQMALGLMFQDRGVLYKFNMRDTHSSNLQWIGWTIINPIYYEELTKPNLIRELSKIYNATLSALTLLSMQMNASQSNDYNFVSSDLNSTNMYG